jgi:prepilin-type N-terminal cleavage/methylation domain-containing protein
MKLKNWTIDSGVSRRLAFTLVELMVAVALGGLVVMAVASMSLYSGRTFAGLANYTDMEAVSLNAIDRMTREIRGTTGLTSFTTNQLTFATGTNAPLVYSYSPGSRTLTRRQGANSMVLLRECDSLQFSVYQRTPIAGTWDLYSLGTATNQCKVVYVNWTCSRQLFGLKVNSENAQSAKIVIRAL